MTCAHCHRELLGRRRTFCDDSCRMRAYRRRRAGLAEDALGGGARRGRVPLAGKTRAAQLAELVASLDAAREILDEDMTRDLLEKNRNLAYALDRLAALDAIAEERAERDANMGT